MNRACSSSPATSAGSWSQGSGATDHARQPGDRGAARGGARTGDTTSSAAFALRPDGRRAGARRARRSRSAAPCSRALAKAIHGAREELIALAVANGGNTRGDAKFDIDGGAVTLSHYAELGAKLGAAQLLADGEPIQVGRTARMGGQHVWARAARRRGAHQRLQLPGAGACARSWPARCSPGMPVITQAGDGDRARRAPDGRAVRAAAARGRAAAARRARRRPARSPRPRRRPRVHRRQRHRGDAARPTARSSSTACASTSRPTASTPRSSAPTST